MAERVATIYRQITRTGYARNGNTHNPTFFYHFTSDAPEWWPTLQRAKQELAEEGYTHVVILNSPRTQKTFGLYPHAHTPKGGRRISLIQ